ncbi:MAG: helix-turn-helix transcriptional regulator [Cyclobacteriaceae bacterium]
MSYIVGNFTNKTMNHLARLLSILTILKSKRITTGGELAKKFDVSLRTIYRDVKKLEESGVPIITIEGRGYSIMDGYSVAPIMFNEAEVNALITAEQLIAKTNDDSLIEHFEQTLQKIKSVFKSALQSQGEILNSKMLVVKSKTDEVKTTSLSYIQMAIINFRVTELTYKDKKEETTCRKIEPLAIFCYDETWIVVGWCRLRQDYRSFRLDRIQHFKILEETFEDKCFDLGKFLSCEEINHYP